MMRSFLLSLILLFFLSGCVHSSSFDVSDEEEVSLVNRKGARKQVKLFTQDGRVFTGQGLIMRQDSVHWVDPATQMPRSIAVDEIERIQFYSKGLAVLNGLLIGAGAGALTGVIAANYTSETDTFMPLADPGVSAVLYGVGGGVMGAWIGTFFRVKRSYRVEGNTTPGNQVGHNDF